MSSEKQVLANRQNALKGGVKTDAGKAVVRLNAISHGLFSREVLLEGEDGALLDALREKIMQELLPQGELETVLVERIISSTWRLKRALRSEKKYSGPPSRLSQRGELFPGSDYRYTSWQNYIHYETTIERQIYKAMHELERLQLARRGTPAPPPLVLDLNLAGDEV